MIKSKDPIETKVLKVSPGLLDEGLNDLLPLIKDLDWHYENKEWSHHRSYYNNDGYEEI
jgi:hypothetical protein